MELLQHTPRLGHFFAKHGFLFQPSAKTDDFQKRALARALLADHKHDMSQSDNARVL